MADEDGFLSRWSRLSRAEKRKPPPSAEGRVVPEPVATASQSPELPGAAVAAPEPEFDVTTLPAIEDVSLETDISMFLQKGVPEALKNAVLRKAWALDPAIRDYIGPVENGWDFNDPESIPGFGFLKPDFDSGAMMRQITGEKSPQEVLDAVSGPAGGPVSSDHLVQPEAGTLANKELADQELADQELVSTRPPEGKPGKDRESRQSGTKISRAEEDSAPRDPDENTGQNPAFANKRRHGGALPV